VRTHRGRSCGYRLPTPMMGSEQKRQRILEVLGKLGPGGRLWASEIAHELGLQPSSDRVRAELVALAAEGAIVRYAAKGRDLWGLAEARVA
jgi:predicted ArsR family transcriptional regulator